MKAGDRVRLAGDTFRYELGTVAKVSPAGYVIVDWDDRSLARQHYSPATRFDVVTGEDALPGHDWPTAADQTFPCRVCGVSPTEDTYDAPCRTRSVAA